MILGCVTSGKSLNLSESHFHHLANEVDIIKAKGGARSDAFCSVML